LNVGPSLRKAHEKSLQNRSSRWGYEFIFTLFHFFLDPSFSTLRMLSEQQNKSLFYGVVNDLIVFIYEDSGLLERPVKIHCIREIDCLILISMQGISGI